MRKLVRPFAFVLVAIVAACGGSSKPAVRPIAKAAAPDQHAQNRLATVGVIWTMKNASGETSTMLTTGVAINARAVATSAPFGANGLKIESVTVMVADVGAKNRAVKTTPLGSNEKLDVLVLATEEDMPASVTLQPEPPRIGETAYTLDFQMVTEPSVLVDMHHQATVTFVDPPTAGLQALTIDVGSVTPLSVGCGLYNGRGELIGLVTRPILNQQPVGSRAIVLPAKHLVAFMRSSEVSMTVATASKP